MEEQGIITQDIEVFHDWKSTLPFIPVLKQVKDSIQKIEKEYFQRGKLNVFPSSFMPANETAQHVFRIIQQNFNEGLVIITRSLISLMDIEPPVEDMPRDILCEVMIVVPNHPATVLCVVEDHRVNHETIQNHVLELTQHVTYGVRFFTDEHFSALHGTIDKRDLISPQSFTEALEKIRQKRSRFYHPDALTMGAEKHRDIGLALLASMAVTEIPWQLRTGSPGSTEGEKELWFLTHEQFHILSKTVDLADALHTCPLDLVQKGGEVEAELDGGTFMVLELAKRWNKLQPTLACIKSPLNYPRLWRENMIAHITDIAEVRTGRACANNISQIVAEHLCPKDVDQLIPKRNHAIRSIIFNPQSGVSEDEAVSPGTETAFTRSTTNSVGNQPFEHGKELLQRISVLEETDAQINQDSDLFVETSPFARASSTLHDHKFVVVTGASGDGKTAIARALCRQYRDKSNYTPIIIKHPDEWGKCVSFAEKQIVLIEDMFGKINFSFTNMLLWKKFLPSIAGSLTKHQTNIYLVVTSKQGFIDKALPVLKEIPMFKLDHIVDISMTLSFEDKMSLVEMYGRTRVNPRDVTWETLVLEEDIGFPLTCRIILQRGSSQEDIFNGFRYPVTFLKTNLYTLVQSNSSIKAFLLLLACNGGTMDLEDQEVCRKWIYLQKKLVKEAKQRLQISEIFKSLPMCYVQAYPLKRNIVTFTHQSVFFVATQMFASKNSDLIFEKADVSVLQDLFVLETGATQKRDRVITVPLSKEKILVERFLNALQSNAIGSIFLNGSFNVKSFVQHFLNLLRQRGNVMNILLICKDMDMSPLHYIILCNNMLLFSQVIELVGISSVENGLLKLLLTCCKSGNSDAMNILLSRCRERNFKSTELLDLFLTSLSWSQSQIIQYMLRKQNFISEGQLEDMFSYLFVKSDFQNAALLLNHIASQQLKHCLTKKKYPCSLHDCQCTPVTCLSERNNADMVRLYCDYGANVNAYNSKGNSPLTISIETDNMNLMTTLLSHEANVNAVLGNGETPLHIACWQQNVSAVELLISNGAQVEARTMERKTPLDYACQKGNVSIVRALLDKIGKLKEESTDSLQPIHVAAAVGNNVAVKLLLENGDLVYRKSETMKTPLHFASMNGDKETITLLIKSSADINYPDKDGRTPLHVACEKSNFVAVDLLVREGANVNSIDGQQRTPLLVASREGDLKVVELLTDHGADVNKETVTGQTPLHAATEMGHHSVVKILVQRGADLQKETVDKLTPLNLACRKSNYKIVKTLLGGGANVNTTTLNGWTPLHYACHNGDHTIVKTLLRRGAKADKETDDKNTPLHLACKNGDSETIRLLQKEVHKITTPLRIVCKRGKDVPLKRLASFTYEQRSPKDRNSSEEDCIS